MCLDSGLRATAACSKDVRGQTRVSAAYVYPEDVPSGTCNKHILMNYCVTGGGVCGEYCENFLDAEIETRSLVKLTQNEISEIRDARSAGLVDIYTTDGYVYLVDGDGEAASWRGFSGDINDGVDMPYHICSVHTEEAMGDIEIDGEDGFDGIGMNPDGGMTVNPGFNNGGNGITLRPGTGSSGGISING